MDSLKLRHFLFIAIYVLLSLTGVAQTSERGYIGVETNVDIPTKGYLKVESVRPGSPAARAGLQAGDLITSVSHIPMAGTSSDIIEKFLFCLVGGTVNIQVVNMATRGFSPVDLGQIECVSLDTLAEAEAPPVPPAPS